MNPSKLAQSLRQIAAKIDDSKSPSRALVIRDLKRIIMANDEEKEAKELASLMEKALHGIKEAISGNEPEDLRKDYMKLYKFMKEMFESTDVKGGSDWGEKGNPDFK